VLANTNLCDHFNSAVPKAWVAAQTWVVKGGKWVAPRLLKSVKTNFFLFIFQVLSQFRHRLNYCIICISFGFVLLKPDYCIINSFPRVLMAARLPVA